MYILTFKGSNEIDNVDDAVLYFRIEAEDRFAAMELSRTILEKIGVNPDLWNFESLEMDDDEDEITDDDSDDEDDDDLEEEEDDDDEGEKKH